MGDPINAVKICSDKAADRLLLLEISDEPVGSSRESFFCIKSEVVMPLLAVKRFVIWSGYGWWFSAALKK